MPNAPTAGTFGCRNTDEPSVCDPSTALLPVVVPSRSPFAPALPPAKPPAKPPAFGYPKFMTWPVGLPEESRIGTHEPPDACNKPNTGMRAVGAEWLVRVAGGLADGEDLRSVVHRCGGAEVRGGVVDSSHTS